MMLLLAQGPHLENHCSRAPLKISDKLALPIYDRERTGHSRKLGPQQWHYHSAQITTLPSCTSYVIQLDLGGTVAEEEGRKKTLSVCLLSTPMASPLSSNASCHLESFVSILPCQL